MMGPLLKIFYFFFIFHLYPEVFTINLNSVLNYLLSFDKNSETINDMGQLSASKPNC